MRENVMGELQQMQPEDETKKKMLEILKRFHSREAEGGDEDEEMIGADADDDSTISEELIQKVLSGDEIRLEDLTPEELKQFQRAVASGELSKMIEPWNPWWKLPAARTISLSSDGTQLVMPLQEDKEATISEIPAGPETPIRPLSHLSSTSPSPLLMVHLVDILYSYCFTLRLYNGDWQSDPLGAATEVLTVSAVLGEDGRPETVMEALSACLEKACSPVYRRTGGLKFAVGLIDDIISLLSLGGTALVCLLCDLQRLLKAGETTLKHEKLGKAKRKGESSRKLKSAERKVYFLMCWVHEQPNEAWASLASIVEVEKASVLAAAQGSKKPIKKGGGDGLQPTKALIEEV